MSGYPTGIVPGAGIPKEQVNYRHHEQCSTCNYFYPLNSCRIVDGNISPEAVCDKWEMTEPKGSKDKKFFQKEYEKQENKGGES